MAYTANQLIGMGYGGYSGWDDAGANADFNATHGAGKQTPSSSGSSSSNNSFDSNSFFNNLQNQQNALTQQQATDTANRFNQDKTDISNFNTSFQNAVQGANGQPSLGDTINARYNVPQATGYASALQQQINNLNTNADNSGAGGYAGMNQVNGALGQLNNKEAIAGTYAQGQENLASQEYSRELQPYQTQAQMLNDRLAREATSYTAEDQRQLDALVSQMNSGIALSQTQLDLANKLAISEQGYQNAKDVASIEANKVQTVPSGSYVYDPSSGKYKYL